MTPSRNVISIVANVALVTTVALSAVALPILPVGEASASIDPSPPTNFKEGLDKVKDEVRPAAKVREIGSIPELIVSILRFVMSLIAILALAALVWGGVMYILSLGNEDRARTAKRIILFAIVGLVIVIFSALIINVILTLFSAP